MFASLTQKFQKKSLMFNISENATALIQVNFQLYYFGQKHS